MADLKKLARDIGAAPLGDLIASVGRGVAEAQAALDAGSLEQSLALYEEGDDLTRIMRETGYRPTFYAIPETEGELTLSLTVTGRDAPAPAPARSPTLSPLARATLANRLQRTSRAYATPVDAGYRNTYGFSGTVGAKVKFRIVAVPPTSEAAAIRVVPDFSDLRPDEANRLAETFDLGTGGTADAGSEVTVSAQDPAPGSLIQEGSTVTLSFG